MTIDEKIKMMRQLHRYGVSHFVVTDNFYEVLKAKVKQQNDEYHFADPIEEMREPSEEICFRGHRILRKADIEHLPNLTPSASPNPHSEPVEFL